MGLPYFKGFEVVLPHYKTIIEDSVYEIPQRLKEYDDSFFVVFNNNNGRFEVHSTDNLFHTYCMTVPYEELDSRTINLVKANDTKNKGAYEIEKELNAHNAKVEVQKEKAKNKWIDDVARETYSAFKKDLDHEYIGMSRKW